MWGHQHQGPPIAARRSHNPFDSTLVVLPVRRGVLLIVLALLAPTAQAGEESDPEVDDARDLRDASLDLLAAWFSADPGGVRFTIKVAALQGDVADHLYFMSFTLHGEQYLATAGYDGDGELRGHVGNPPTTRDIRGIETFEENVADLEARLGKPGYVTGVIPWNALDGLEPGVVLVDIAAGTSLYHRDRGVWEGGIDTRGTDRTYTTERVLLKPGLAKWLAVGGVGLVALAGAGGTAFVIAKRRAAGSGPPPVTVPVQGPPPAARPQTPREPAKPAFNLRPPG